ncbi:hypothetical protein CIG19_21055 [Enterobacterales bacterium CwR94]|nr:hypothetical protein CIG19_21055 [Enterobacterales bacterium CwR94]
MSWPIKLLLEINPPRDVNFKRWFVALSLVSIASCIAFVFSLINVFSDWKYELQQLSLLFVILITVLLFSFFLRIYVYGLYLSAYHDYCYNREGVKKEWSEWATKQAYLYDTAFFIANKSDVYSMLRDVPFELKKDQAVIFDKVYTRKEIFYELLLSVRQTLLALAHHTGFDMIIINEENSSDVNDIRSLWARLEIDSEKLHTVLHTPISYEKVISEIIDGDSLFTKIVIALKLNDPTSENVHVSDFATINIITNRNLIGDVKPASYIYRPHQFLHNDLQDEAEKHAYYQPQIYTSKKVWLGEVAGEQGSYCSKSLSTLCHVSNKHWDMAGYDLSLILGKIESQHSWLILSLLSTASQFLKSPQMTITNCDEQYLINLIDNIDNTEREV